MKFPLILTESAFSAGWGLLPVCVHRLKAAIRFDSKSYRPNKPNGANRIASALIHSILPIIPTTPTTRFPPAKKRQPGWGCLSGYEGESMFTCLRS